MQRILFVFPNTANTPVIPNAIACLAGIAKSFFYDVEYFDTFMYKKSNDSGTDRELSAEFKPCNIDRILENKPFEDLVPDLQNKIVTAKPDIIAISCMSFEYEFLVSFFPKIIVPKNVFVVIGGIHSILKPEDVVNTGLFDLVCIGEGDITFSDILIRIKNKGDLSSIENTYYRNRIDGTIIKNNRRKLQHETELWNVIPDYSIFNNQYFLYPFDGTLYRRFNIEFSRGCPYSCTYCGNAALQQAYKGLGKFVRKRPIGSIKEHILRMIREHDIELFYFQDECFFLHSAEWLSEVAEWYGKYIKIPYIIQTRPETITQDKIDILKSMNAPFFQVSCGIESGSEKILQRVANRKTEINTIINVFDILKKNEIRTCAFFMIGFPYETKEDIWKSIELCRIIRPSVAIVSIFQPMIGQKLREVCIEEGYMTGYEKLTTFTSGSILNMPQISSDELSNLRRVFMLYAYLPEKYYSDIERCEKDFLSHKKLYNELVEKRWALSE